VKNVIFGVAVVFPVVITFGVAGVLAARHAQAIVQGFFPWSSPSAPWAGTLLVKLILLIVSSAKSIYVANH